MPMTLDARKDVGDHLLGKGDIATRTDLYMALFTANPTSAGLQTNEVTGTGYARINVTGKFDAFDAATGIATSNDEINFGSPGSDWGTISYVGFLSASSGGTMRYYEALPNPRNATNGSRPVKFSAGQVQIRHV